MHRSTFRRTTVLGAFVLMAAAPLAACGADSLSPLPVRATQSAPVTTAPAPVATSAGTSPSSTATRPGNSPPTVAAPASTGKPAHTTTRPTTRPPTTRPTGTCYGAVRHDLDLQNTELALIKSMCFHVGGVLRLKGIGPGLVTAQPASLVSQNYEAGVVDLRFVRTGTVTVSIPQEEQTYTITVVVID
jgi:hypothetical protein